MEDKTGKIWIGSQEGLSVFDGLTISRLSTNFIGNMFEDPAGNIWLSETNPKKAKMTLVRFDGKTFTDIYSSTQVLGSFRIRTRISGLERNMEYAGMTGSQLRVFGKIDRELIVKGLTGFLLKVFSLFFFKDKINTRQLSDF